MITVLRNSAHGEEINKAHTVSIQSNGKHICGGVLIRKDLVITAAKCSYNENAKLQVRVGSKFEHKGGQLVDVLYKDNHVDFNRRLDSYDISLLKLAKKVNLSTKVKTIALATAGSVEGTSAYISGWKPQNDGGASKPLSGNKVKLISQSDCQKAFKRGRQVTHQIRKYNVCSRSASECKTYETGSPMIIDGKLSGIVSKGSDCLKPDSPTIYTSIPELKKWIETTISQKFQK